MIVNTTNNSTLPGGNRGVLAVANYLLQKNEPFALVIVVSSQGSTYRKPGALALVARNGTTQSVISGGCLEPALRDEAMHVISTDTSTSLLLDTSTDDDLIFGSGTGCRGRMRVLIIPVMPDNPHPVYKAIVSAHQMQQPVKLALAINKHHCGNGMAWCGDQRWSFGDRITDMDTLRNAAIAEHTVISAIEDSISNSVQQPVTIATFIVEAPRRLFIIGAGVETPLVIRMARTLGWHTTLADHRETQLESFANEADESMCSRPLALSNDLKGTCFDAALIMSHNASIDLEGLQLLAPRAERYVGLLGPPARRDELLQQLTDTQRDQLSQRLHAPLGLRLGGDGPESLALSITAELQHCFHHG